MNIEKETMTEVINPQGTKAVLVAYRGSIAHGMYVPPAEPTSVDDKDVMAFVIAPVDCYLGLSDYGSRGTIERQREELDLVSYDFLKAIRLLLAGNPNVLSMLWVPDNYVIFENQIGKELRSFRSHFVGRHVYKPFVGYAKSQLEKMTRGLYQGYMGEKRKALVDQFGYDTKSAAHLIRLLRMGTEFLKDGELIVDRGGYDATELLGIKRGEWELEKVKEEADRLFKRAEDLYDRCTLPQGPNRAGVEKLTVQWLKRSLGFIPM